ncbi:MAG: helix-turn-helix transcriptional regulator [Deltaproteobacteria bacterium]|nr:helix-turn-helix transcriptional regulator [Deltaproteobacteria bacterium]MBW2382541.1 helix-turn-helix transcriptional regulator [Deltaproteobacteria bacterium]
MAGKSRKTKRPEPLTASGIVSLNVRRIREEKGWTQAHAGERLEKVTGRPFSVATVSALERGWDRTGPERAFTINELDAISLAFGVALLELLLPPSKAETTRRLPSRWVQRLVWSESHAVAARAEALAHDKRSTELVERLARGEQAFRLGVRKAHQFRLKRLADKLRDTASELDKASRPRA